MARPATGTIVEKRYEQRRQPNRPVSRRWLWVISWLNLAAVLGVWGLLWGVADDYWIGTALLYLPRFPFALPAAVLIPLAFKRDRRAILLNLVAVAIVIGPVMGLRLNVAGAMLAVPEKSVTAVSCNVQFFRPDFASVTKEVFSFHPDVIAFQDAKESHPLLEPFFRGWNVVHEGEFLIASKHPLKLVAQCETQVYERLTAIMCEVADPAGPFRVVSLHHMSPREGLSSIRPGDILAEAGDRPVDQELILRGEEAAAVRDFIEQNRGELPLLVMGDFNFPVESQLYQSNWGDMTNTFDAGGLGYGYTILCTTRSLWPSGWPWCRIDHIVASPEWDVQRAWAGSSNGSDHRCMAAVLNRLPGFKVSPSADAKKSPGATEKAKPN